MSQTLNKVNSGDPLKIPATAYNAFVEAALAHRQSQQNVMGGMKPGLPSNALNLVKVRNDSGADVPQYGILGIGGSVFDPAAGWTSGRPSWCCPAWRSPTVPWKRRFVICPAPQAE